MSTIGTNPNEKLVSDHKDSSSIEQTPSTINNSQHPLEFVQNFKSKSSSIKKQFINNHNKNLPLGELDYIYHQQSQQCNNINRGENIKNSGILHPQDQQYFVRPDNLYSFKNNNNDNEDDKENYH